MLLMNDEQKVLVFTRTTKKYLPIDRLRTRIMELAHFSAPKDETIFPGKTGFRGVQLQKLHLNPTPPTLLTKLQNRDPQLKLCLLCSSPSSVLSMVLFSCGA